MKANEIRIGNLVEYTNDGVVFEVTEVQQFGIGVRNDKEETWIELDQFSPLSLTEEWLLKFGFEQLCEDEFIVKVTVGNHVIVHNYWDQEDQVSYAWHMKWNDEDQLDFNHIGLKYVHQLQNLFFALTGEELTIK